MQRRTLLKSLFAAGLLPLAAHAQAAQIIEVYKTPTCGCCHDWVAHLEQNGFTVKTHDVPNTTPYRARFGVPKELASCHTGVIDGYALEGHVPATEIKRLLAERPKARGLAVPGMPVGTPGMEVEGTRRDAHDVILFADDGSRQVYRHYAAQS
jgi:hypothetical protein